MFVYRQSKSTNTVLLVATYMSGMVMVCASLTVLVLNHAPG